MAKPTAYITLLPGYTHREPFFQTYHFWGTIRDRLRPYRLLCKPMRKIPKDARLVLFNDFKATRESIDFISKRSPDTLHLIMHEPPTYLPFQHTPACTDHFSRVYAFRNDFTDPKFHMTYVPHPLKSRPPSPDQRLLSMVVSNKASSHPNQLYTERRRLIHFFEDKPEADFAFYGTGWEYNGYRTYGGAIADKLATISNFRFSIAYENGHGLPGYVTEKILDCLCAGTVPIYWGAPNITDYVPADCFIDRTQFSSNQELYDFLLTCDTAPYLAAARKFLSSDKAQLFSEERFIDQITTGFRQTLD